MKLVSILMTDPDAARLVEILTEAEESGALCSPFSVRVNTAPVSAAPPPAAPPPVPAVWPPARFDAEFARLAAQRLAEDRLRAEGLVDSVFFGPNFNRPENDND